MMKIIKDNHTLLKIIDYNEIYDRCSDCKHVLKTPVKYQRDTLTCGITNKQIYPFLDCRECYRMDYDVKDDR